MKHVHLATAVLVRDERVLLVASRYPNQPQPLWNLPGGRQQPGELLADTAVRECAEETGYTIAVTELAYISESYDRAGDAHFINATFAAEIVAEPDDAYACDANDHVVETEWVRIEDVADRIAVAVVREPLLAFLRGELRRRYAGFEDAGITIRWPNESV